MTKIAFVTGASRGIGRAIACELAESGYDVAISARKVDEHLKATAERIESLGKRSLMVPLDLLDRDSIRAASESVLAELGQLDVLVNNAIYQGDDLNSPLMELSIDTLDRVFKGYFVGPLELTREFLPAMVRRQDGVIVNITSGAGESDPPVPATRGGWGYAYGAGKAAVSRLAGIINVELGGSGVRAYTLNPGVVLTETLKSTIGDRGIAALGGTAAPPEVPAKVVSWLVDADQVGRFTRRTVQAQKIALDHYLVKDWRS